MFALWLHGRPEHTQRAYTADALRFLAHTGKPLATLTLRDLQNSPTPWPVSPWRRGLARWPR
jgi:hypothetical protein